MAKSSAGDAVTIINAFHLFFIVMTASFFLGLLTDLAPAGEMRAAVIAAIYLFSDLAFAGIGVALFIAGRTEPVTWLNKLFPWLTLVTFSVAVVPPYYEWLTGPVDDQTLGYIGLGTGSLLFAIGWFETRRFHLRSAHDRGDAPS